MSVSSLLEKLKDPKSFHFQFPAAFLSLYLLTLLVSTIGCAISTLGTSIILSWLAWNITKYIQKQYFHESVDSSKKAVLVTGCDTGFGHLLAKRLNSQGFTVYAGCMDPNGPGALDLVKSVAFPKRLKVVLMDVTDDTHVERVHTEISKSVEKEGLKLWGIVNNAGIATVAHIEWGTLANYQKVMDVNTTGVARVTRTFLPLIRKSKGRIVNVASMAGRAASLGLGVYCMSKHAVIAFSNALRLEMLGWGVKVSTIEPTFYKTQIVDIELRRAEAKKVWAETDPTIRKDYGQEYFDDSLNMIGRDEGGNPEEVVDAMMDAITAKHPQIAYRVCNLKFAIIWFFVDYLPYSIVDQLTNIRNIQTKPTAA